MPHIFGTMPHIFSTILHIFGTMLHIFGTMLHIFDIFYYAAYFLIALYIMDIMDIMDILNIMIITARMAMAGAVSALVFFGAVIWEPMVVLVAAGPALLKRTKKQNNPRGVPAPTPPGISSVCVVCPRCRGGSLGGTVL